MRNTKGQATIVNAVSVIALIIIWILLSPFFKDFIDSVLAIDDYGGVTNFLIKIIHWVGLGFLIFLLIKTLQGYEGQR